MTTDCAPAAFVRIDHALDQLRVGLHESAREMERLCKELETERTLARGYSHAIEGLQSDVGRMRRVCANLTGERDRALTAIRAYKDAPDDLKADAEAALFRVLEEMEYADCK